MTRFRLGGLRARLSLLAIVAVLPAFLLVLYMALAQRADATEAARKDALNLARALATSQERLTLEVRQFLVVLAEVDLIRTASPACEAFLARLLAQGTQFVNLGAADLDGTVYCSALPAGDSVNLADRSYFQRAVATGDFAVGDYQIGRITGIPSINFGYPIESAGATAGVVFSAVPLAWIHEQIAAAELPEGSAVTVVDATWTVLARVPDGDEWIGRRIGNDPMADAIGRAREDRVVRGAGLDGVQRLHAAAALSEEAGAESPYVIVGIPTRTAFAATDRLVRRSLATLLLLSLLLALAAWWGSDVFVLRPFRSLVLTTRRLAAGDLAARTALGERRGELGELGRSFNHMAGALEEREHQIQEHLAESDRMKRVLAVLSAVKSFILRLQDRDELLHEVCRVGVEQGGFAVAAVHLADAESSTPRLIVARESRAGEGTSLLPERIDLEQEPFRTALAEEGALVFDSAGQPERPFLRDRKGHATALAGIILPLRVHREIGGVLTFLAADYELFAEPRRGLLQDLASDVSLALDSIERARDLDRLANYDPLTGLPNRTLFADRLAQSLAQAREEGESVAVLTIRIDRIAQLNASVGHHAGDDVIREVAASLASVVPPGATVGRLGSGDFGIVLPPPAGARAAERTTREIFARVPASVRVGDDDIFVSLSIGVAIHPEDGADGGELVRNATLARDSSASDFSHTQAFYSPALNSSVQEKRHLERDLRHAIAAGELKLYYQPVVDAHTRRLIAVESLIRWPHPERGFVSPGDFIPLAEETGLIAHIGEWSLATACQQGRRWMDAGFGAIRVNVNVSVSQLREKSFVDRISTILEETGFDASRLALGLEITETELMENLELAVEAIREFRRLGLAIYIDDFGTGYSSLAYLRQLPIDTLKIDGSFVRDIPNDADALAVVTAIIAMAKSLDLRVVAEGVETEEQFATLVSLGCDSVQGFLFGKAVPPEEVTDLFGRAL